MPVKPHHSDPNTVTLLQVRLPGWLKNQILDTANANGQSLNTWVAAALHEAVNKPAVEPSERRTPTVADVIADYLSGEATTAPCGRVWPCEGTGVEPVSVNGVSFCTVCNVRV